MLLQYAHRFCNTETVFAYGIIFVTGTRTIDMIAVHCTLVHTPFRVFCGDKVLCGEMFGTHQRHSLNGVG